MTGEIGTLRVGAAADVLVVEGDPVADIAALAEPERIRHVVQGGQLV